MAGRAAARHRMPMQFVEANGAPIPIIGLGTWELRGNTCARIVEQALRLGYRHVDTARMYGNEREVGEGLRAAGVPRKEVFVTTKVWPTDFAPGDLERSAKDSLKELRLSEVDLLLLHWPNPSVPLADTLGALCQVKQVRLARHIGVSNFTVTLIEQAARLAAEPLVTDQIEYHPYLDQSKVIAACRRRGMSVTAYSPVARGRTAQDRVLERIGRAHGKTAAQVSLRWLVQQGIVVIPRSSKPQRLAENLAIFEFELTAAEMNQIAALAHLRGRLVDASWVSGWD